MIELRFYRLKIQTIPRFINSLFQHVLTLIWRGVIVLDYVKTPSARHHIIVILLAFSILCSTGILIIFKLIPRSDALTTHTILLSYGVSALAGLLILPVSLESIWSSWSFVAAFVGIAFYAVFHLMARSAAASGVAFTAVATKMSVIIPITIGLVFLGDTGNVFVFIGVLLGLLAVMLCVGNNVSIDQWRWPLLVFLGAGLIDASFKLFQVWGLPESNFPGFIVSIFAFAFLTGLTAYFRNDRARIGKTSAVYGLALGLFNLGTVYFLMKALAIPDFTSTVIYSINSFGIVLMSMVVALALFREHIPTKGYLGIAMAIGSIIFLYMAQVQ